MAMMVVEMGMWEWVWDDVKRENKGYDIMTGRSVVG